MSCLQRNINDIETIYNNNDNEFKTITTENFHKYITIVVDLYEFYQKNKNNNDIVKEMNKKYSKLQKRGDIIVKKSFLIHLFYRIPIILKTP